MVFYVVLKIFNLQIDGCKGLKNAFSWRWRTICGKSGSVEKETIERDP